MAKTEALVSIRCFVLLKVLLKGSPGGRCLPTFKSFGEGLAVIVVAAMESHAATEIWEAIFEDGT